MRTDGIEYVSEDFTQYGKILQSAMPKSMLSLSVIVLRKKKLTSFQFSISLYLCGHNLRSLGQSQIGNSGHETRLLDKFYPDGDEEKCFYVVSHS